jgi:prolyl-tRNA synthetase
MRYSELAILTLRQSPNVARSSGQALLMRAGFINRDNSLTTLGVKTVETIKNLVINSESPFFQDMGLDIYENSEETYVISPLGTVELIFCPSCHHAERADLAPFMKIVQDPTDALPLEGISTPGCSTIDSLARYLQVPSSKTSKAMMVVKAGSDQFVFVVLRGDMQLSESKLRKDLGEFRLATEEEIRKMGAEPGYASPIGLKKLTVWVDDLIPISPNLVAGANKPGFHYRNSNCSRDYVADKILDLSKAESGFPCIRCGQPLKFDNALLLATRKSIEHENLLLALAEIYHDDKGLCLPQKFSPFDVYLMHLPSRELDTKSKAEVLYHELLAREIRVLFDDRDERAGVKFNDADLIGVPLRITVGDRNLKNGMVELKPRTASEAHLLEIEKLGDIKSRTGFWK